MNLHAHASVMTHTRLREIEEQIAEHDEQNALLTELLREVKLMRESGSSSGLSLGGSKLEEVIRARQQGEDLNDLNGALAGPKRLQLSSRSWDQALMEVIRLRTRFERLVVLLREIGIVASDDEEEVERAESAESAESAMRGRGEAPGGAFERESDNAPGSEPLRRAFSRGIRGEPR